MLPKHSTMDGAHGIQDEGLGEREHEAPKVHVGALFKQETRTLSRGALIFKFHKNVLYMHCSIFSTCTNTMVKFRNGLSICHAPRVFPQGVPSTTVSKPANISPEESMLREMSICIYKPAWHSLLNWPFKGYVKLYVLSCGLHSGGTRESLTP